MRRKDREVLGDENIAKIIEQCTTCHIAMVDDADARMSARSLTASARIRTWRLACASRTASRFTKMFIARAGAFTQASSGQTVLWGQNSE